MGSWVIIIFQLLLESFASRWISGTTPGIKFLSESSESMLDRLSERDLFRQEDGGSNEPKQQRQQREWQRNKFG